ncbi:MAG: prepilin-type N-terminal cleavage/methylation domain-containing protein [Clostridiales bacterium]|nr:prepilin-type N-terminal cleavage/methylation domain-containing protein [Clostridiales bacterium]
MLRVSKMSKRGFTLLETMLSVALLLIVSLVAYEGFMTTMSVAADTALADRMSNDNQKQVYNDVSVVTNGGGETGYNTGTAIFVSGGGVDSCYQVTKVTGAAGASHFTGTALMQDAQFTNTTNRHGFYYTARCCDRHNEPLKYYEVTDGSGTKYVEGRCPYKDATGQCTYKIRIT